MGHARTIPIENATTVASIARNLPHRRYPCSSSALRLDHSSRQTCMNHPPMEPEKQATTMGGRHAAGGPARKQWWRCRRVMSGLREHDECASDAPQPDYDREVNKPRSSRAVRAIHHASKPRPIATIARKVPKPGEAPCVCNLCWIRKVAKRSEPVDCNAKTDGCENCGNNHRRLD